MQLSSLLLTLTLLPFTISAATPQRYKLKTHVTKGSKSKDNLYVAGYHTGAGFNDAVLVGGGPDYRASVGFLNGTYQQFSLGGSDQNGNEIPWGFYMGGAANYAGWEPVGLNVGYGDEGFYFNNTDGTGKGLKWSAGYPYFYAPEPNNEFIGWLACDWFHGLPQLFWRVRNGVLGFNATLISTCSEVELLREFV